MCGMGAFDPQQVTQVPCGLREGKPVVIHLRPGGRRCGEMRMLGSITKAPVAMRTSRGSGRSIGGVGFDWLALHFLLFLLNSSSDVILQGPRTI